jgi:CubicO group peptidase (beta-lactamase class C family)
MVVLPVNACRRSAACVALLVADGVVSVDDPVSRWLPGLPA